MLQGLGFWAARAPVVSYTFTNNSVPDANNYLKLIINGVTYLDTSSQGSSSGGGIYIPVYPVCQVGIWRNTSITTSVSLLVTDLNTNTVLITQNIAGTYGFASALGHKYLIEATVT